MNKDVIDALLKYPSIEALYRRWSLGDRNTGEMTYDKSPSISFTEFRENYKPSKKRYKQPDNEVLVNEGLEIAKPKGLSEGLKGQSVKRAMDKYKKSAPILIKKGSTLKETEKKEATDKLNKAFGPGKPSDKKVKNIQV